MRKGDEATDKSFMDTIDTVSSVLGRNPISEKCAHETWKIPRATHGILVSLVGQRLGRKRYRQEGSIEF